MTSNVALRIAARKYSLSTSVRYPRFDGVLVPGAADDNRTSWCSARPPRFLLGPRA